MSLIKLNEKGFTMVEMIVILSLLFILAAIGISRYSGLTDKARLEADHYTAATIASAAQSWISENDSTYKEETIFITDLKETKLLEDIEYKTQTTEEEFEIYYNYITNEIKVMAGKTQFFPPQ